MDRLTRKDHKPRVSNYEYYNVKEMAKKLGKHEDIEEDLGCPITVREKAFNKGFYDKNGNHYICEHYVPYLKSMHTRGVSIGCEKRFKLSDYRITWWLKKDKSE